MAEEFNHAEFVRSLEEFRFDDAEALVAAAPSERLGDARAELEQRRAEAEKLAAERYQRIIHLGAEHDYAQLSVLRRDPAIPALLAMLSDAARQRAELFLKEADRWEASRRETAARRLREARRALDGLDLELARGLLARVDDRLLDDEGRAERDQLLLDISARAMEVETLQAAADRLIEESRPKRNRWWPFGRKD